MKESYIQAVLESSKYIVNEVTKLEHTVKEVSTKKSPYYVDGVAVFIGMTGSVKGQTIITMSHSLANRIASVMLGNDVPKEDFFELSVSALCELGNLILGHTTSAMYEKGINMDITPPTIIMGNNIQISVDKSEIFNIPIIFSGDNAMEIYIAMSGV